MPELPDVEVYRERLEARLVGQQLLGVRLRSPFLLRTAVPPLSDATGRTFRAVRRVGKRLALGLDGDLWLVIHLMVAGRLRWAKVGAKPPGQGGLAAFDLPTGTLIFTEVSKKKRASLHVVAGEGALADFDRGGLDPLTATPAQVAERLRAERHTLKRSLTDPTLFDGIGGAYGDEILHRAGLSPVAWSDGVDDAGIARLTDAMRDVLTWWTDHLRAEVGDGFPDKVTAFRPEMAVHGRHGQPCPVCGDPVQRIVYADRETNYCATCQTGGVLLRDRALSQLLKKDWPRTLEELEELRRR
ncbi:MAG: formamidopyrimidine-DNA glycosylase [Alphaproteobacteria bacterium]|nr:formamidopyrimidine-DNA glycosylase [Alphaproteobacteria bacterium]